MKTINPNESTTTKTASNLDAELTRPSLSSLLSSIRTPDGKPKYDVIQGKPVIFIDVKTVLTDQSEKFQDKLLCDGLTMNAGDACTFSCTFCYVPEAVIKLHKDRLDEFNRETGLNLTLDQVVIRRRGFLEVLKRQLLHPDGSRIYKDPNDNRVLYSSTLVDVAGNMELLQETADACILVFENTEWQIRLLSKNPILKLLVTKGLIPKKYHHRLILGFSTGTLDNGLAAAIERGTGKVSQRIKALHELQDLRIRTFGMICPSLPYGTQEEYDEFSRAMCEALRVDRCEHVWAEVINVRGESLTRTVDALREAGYEMEAERLAAVSGAGSKAAWEEYARMTFEAHQKHIPAAKLRYLQYVNERSAGCWACHRNSGAVLLGKHAEENNLITIGTSAPSEPLPDLGEDDVRYRDEREKIVAKFVAHSLVAAKALDEIYTYLNGLLWRKDFRSFADYCANRWGFQKSHAYRLMKTGGFLTKLEQADSPIGEKVGLTESHLRPVLEIVPEERQIDCWKWVVKQKPKNGKLTGAHVKKQTTRFLKKEGIEPKNTRPTKLTKPDERSIARSSIQRLEAELAKVVPKEQFQPLLDQLLRLVDSAEVPHKADATMMN